MKLLLIGPFPPPITGNSLINQAVKKLLPLHFGTEVRAIDMSFPEFGENSGTFSARKALFYAKRYLYLPETSKADIVYVVPGLTFWGVIKYIPYITLSKMLRKKVVVHIHGNNLFREHERLRGLGKSLFGKALSSVDMGIVLSPSLKKNLAPFLPEEKIHVLANFVEDNLFDIDMEDKIKTGFDDLRILYLSNLMREKGILDLLEALKVLKSEGMAFTATLAGDMDASLKPSINEYLEALKGYVRYVGVVTGSRKKEILFHSNTFVFPTYYRIEGQPISILEAMAAGNIILTTDQGGICDVFEHGKNGFYVEKQNPRSIARQLEAIGKNLSHFREIAINNHCEVKRKYRVDAFIENLHSMLHSLNKQPASRLGN